MGTSRILPNQLSVLLSHTGAAHHERCPHTRPGFVASHRAAAHLHAPNHLLRAIVGPGHVRLPVEDPVIGPMFTQTDEQQAQLIQEETGVDLARLCALGSASTVRTGVDYLPRVAR